MVFNLFSDMTPSILSDTSSKYGSQQDLEGTEKPKDSINISGKTKKEGVKIKVVASRYKAAAAAARNKSQCSNSSGSSSSHSKSWSSETLNAPPPSVRKNYGHRSRPVRVKPEELLRTKPVIPSKQSTSHPAATHHSGPQRNTAVHASRPKPTKFGGSKPSKSAAVVNILHSTALNTTLMTDVANTRNNSSMFSSTMVNGVTPGGFKSNVGRAALLELPDLSVIKLEGNNSGNRTVLSSVSEEAPQNDFVTNMVTPRDVTPEMLEQEYMKYLQWAYVDVSSENAYAAQVKEMQNQIVFLEQLVSEKQEEVSEVKQKTDLLVHHRRVGEACDMQVKLLQILGDGLPACEEAEMVMERELQKKLHQIKMENIYVPQDHIKYRDELSNALDTQVSLLQEFEKSIEPQTHQRNSTIKLLADLQNITDHIQRCEKEMHQAADLAVEEASHQLGAQQMTVAAESFK
ncbi:hypothetical protein GWK47_041803 [Chionoecetes opilio]|uniref:Uncharacterized protein n=1 Tax=Chionoecetes opilio TaxID=41210 RepID=A0A8J4YAV4_CHIOP|nr:hypothetical protein GWK47_041803 [Chionoecetes opilio]